MQVEIVFETLVRLLITGKTPLLNLKSMKVLTFELFDKYIRQE